MLADTNIYYRHPARYDQLGDGPGTAKLVAELTGSHGPAEVRWVLDLGCGTGRDLRHVAQQYPGSVCVGVDVQPEMITFARTQAPALDWRVGDLRTVRLGHPADVVLSLGNSLAYLHDDDGLRAAFATLAAHAHPSTLLLLYLPIAPTPTGAPTRQRSGSFPADVEISYQWDPRSQIETMTRAWLFDDGHQEHDVIRRRVIGPDELTRRLAGAGFELLELFGSPDRRGAPPDGPGAYAVARARA